MSYADYVSDMARHFRVATDQTVSVELAYSFVKEEGAEMVEAGDALKADPNIDTMKAYLKELGDFSYVLAGLAVSLEERNAQGGHQASIGDIEMILDVKEFGGIASASVNLFVGENQLKEIIERVHASNMTKIGPDGQISRNADGKVLKGDFYVAPNLEDIAEEALGRFLEFISGFEKAVA